MRRMIGSTEELLGQEKSDWVKRKVVQEKGDCVKNSKTG